MHSSLANPLYVSRVTIVFGKKNLQSSKLQDELEKRANALITYRNEILAHADSGAYKKSGVDDFLTKRYIPQTSKELLDALLEESHKLYAEGLREISGKFNLNIEPEIYAEYNDIEESIEPIGTGILTAPPDLLGILRMVERAIDLKAEDAVRMLSPEEREKLKEILSYY